MRAKKYLGQHFLQSPAALGAIIHAGNLSDKDVVLEIGPGKGALTKKLLEKAGKVIAVEKDAELIPYLAEKFKVEIEEGRLVIIEGDILEKEIEDLVPSTYKLIANIPYNITGQIFRKFLTSTTKPSTMVLLVQKEVADRIIARDGKESILSLSVKAFGTPKYIKTVRAGSFVPPPEVDSAVLAINDLSGKSFETLDEKSFFELLHYGFAHKRKKLFGNLKNYFNKESLTTIFQETGVGENARAEDLDLATWLTLAEKLYR